jgi:hypothetical protein
MQQAGDRADKLSMFATYFGNPALVNEQVDRYRAVTAERVTTFARERLGEDNRATLAYVPREEGRTRRGEEGGASQEGGLRRADPDVDEAVRALEVQG